MTVTPEVPHTLEGLVLGAVGFSVNSLEPRAPARDMLAKD